MSFQNTTRCIACQTEYNNQRSLSMHLSNSQYCVQMLTNFQNQIVNINHYKHSAANTASQNKQQHNDQNQEDNDEASNSTESCQTGDNEHIESDASITVQSFAENQTLHFSNNIIHEIKLLQLVNELGTPLYAYKRILDWAKEAQLSNFNFESQHGTYQQTINFLEHKLLLGITRPQTINVNMYKDNLQIDVVVFDVKKMLLSLFDNKDLNKKENLVVNASDSFAKYMSSNNRLGEVNSGKWYRVAYNNCITDPEKDFLCPIILASDKTTISEMGDLHVDAIFMTTSLFDYKVRQDFEILVKSKLSLLMFLRQETMLQLGVLLLIFQEKKITIPLKNIRESFRSKRKLTVCSSCMQLH